ncbi:MAG: Holliday junction DNA helicase RuvB, holliday junction DNA helicase RuvB [Candidatus Peregrinibacteria bacterium GW2011_GWF2_33_10]|nr:MAG: Holliday junction DNA helicase RuvB, holliday junction DNA helicase RuvB [Candidatus Peregrinibacteria bacterium GW2011_GWF2_33_10]OGJ45052.1 MAG: Holliday junction DNA helicase RuvB [Candidatus Peregrinibacteria bacterium RIFOXYA2_FULL_33_21]OGJ46045.1 MAG: Holliday junction DNA helicase RuvB [Candidatus Peregrinibacteria bacterium RIFOXYA12_FULL_33_12]OGJ50864.1 MAG: Holliday junction DNA helicase RuvB [Candidatus Peregrinibacteria bacterium RIFOXYB2_FULL_33_20]
MTIIRQKKEKITNSEKVAPDILVEEINLRPKLLTEYIGQNPIKDNLQISIKASKKKQEPMDHLLIYGAAGLGKTTLANIIANECAVNIKITSGPALEKPGDLASVLTNLKEHEILFIDEIHRLKPTIEEILYSAMEDFRIDIIIGKGPGARTMRLKIPQFTLIGATTKMSMLSSPLRDRFGHILKLDFYSDEEIGEIINRSANILKCSINHEAAKILSKSARQTPRIANRLLKRCHDLAIINDMETIDVQIVTACLELLKIDNIGLNKTDREILITIIDKFRGGPVGLNTIAAAVSEDENTIEDAYEPYLIKIGFIERTARGRVVTEHAYKHLNINNYKFTS